MEKCNRFFVDFNILAKKCKLSNELINKLKKTKNCVLFEDEKDKSLQYKFEVFVASDEKEKICLVATSSDLNLPHQKIFKEKEKENYGFFYANAMNHKISLIFWIEQSSQLKNCCIPLSDVYFYHSDKNNYDSQKINGNFYEFDEFDYKYMKRYYDDSDDDEYDDKDFYNYCHEFIDQLTSFYNMNFNSKLKKNEFVENPPKKTDTDKKENTKMFNNKTLNMDSLMKNIIQKTEMKLDLINGNIGIQNADGSISSIQKNEDDGSYYITSNIFDIASFNIPAFAISIEKTSIALADLIFQNGKPFGWVIDVNDKEIFKILTLEGTEVSWRPPKKTSFGFFGSQSSVMVVKSPFNMFGGAEGSSNMNVMAMALLMDENGNLNDNSGETSELFSLMMLSSAINNKNNAENGMMNMMLMLSLFGEKGNSGNQMKNILLMSILNGQKLM